MASAGIHATLESGEDIGGVSGTVSMFVEPCIMAFAEPGVGIHVYQLRLLIAPASPDLERTPSLLGRDVLDRWMMMYNPPAGELAFEVRGSDLLLPVSPDPPHRMT